MSWHLGRLAALDFESTAADPETARPVSACLALVGGGQETELRRWLIDAGVEIPAEAQAIHGISTDDVRNNGIPAREAIEQIMSEVDLAMNAGCPLVIYNASYDITLLDRECRRQLGIGLPLEPGLRPVVDPFIIDKALDRYRRGKRTLTAGCEHYQCTLDEAHTAHSDALAAARLAWRLACVFPQECGDVEALHDRQVTWAAEQAASFADYLRKLAAKPENEVEREQLLARAASVDGSWPLRPVASEAAA